MRRVPPSACERTLFVIRKLAENRVRERGVDPAGYFHVASLSTETIVYKGLLLPQQLPQFLRRSASPRHGERDRGRALAVLDEHVPDVGPRAAVPLHRAQRRDQHAARQHATGCRRARSQLQEREVRRRARAAVPDHRARQERLGAVRQHGRAAHARRPHAAARDDDDDPRGVGRERGDGRRPQELLSLRVVARRAVGRSGGDRVLRRPARRRDARSQRPAARALDDHDRRPRHPRVGDRRDRRAARAGARRRAACSPA